MTAESRAAQVQNWPAECGQHRALIHVELLLTSTAAIVAPTGQVLDEDVDLTAQITGPSVEWLPQ